MKKKTLSVLFVCLCFYPQGFVAKSLINGVILLDKVQYESRLKLECSHVLFKENKGQVKNQHWQPRPDVLYYGQSESMNFFIRSNGISYQVSQVDSWKEEENPMDNGLEQKSRHVPDQIIICRVDVNWLNAQTPKAHVRGEQPGYSNYYNVPGGAEPALLVKQYEGITFKDVWPGVNIEYYSRNGHLESDWIVHRAEDYKQIAFEITGAELRIEEGNLVMKTPLGEIVEGLLYVEQNGKAVPSRWEIKGNVVQLTLKNYNPKQPLRIDPPVRIWGTYYGGSNDDFSRSCAVDGIGNVYLTGHTESLDAIATTESHQVTFGGGNVDAFLVKFDNSGQRLWGTYYGGSSRDYFTSCAVDGSGNVYLVGLTSSTNSISTAGTYQTTFGGVWDAILVKFDNSGQRLWGTYYGGCGEDYVTSCALDQSGNVYLSGSTYSNDSITTTGAHQTTFGGAWDAFLVKFDGRGHRQWSTYYGGIGADWGNSCVVDGNGNVYLAGYTRSTNAISTIGAHQTAHGGANISGGDAFLVKFDSIGQRQWGTYFGGSARDDGFSCVADGSGNVYLAGETYSSDAISTTGSHQVVYGGGSYDAFLVKFDGGGQRQWGTYYGGSGWDYGSSCALDGSGNVYMAGYTESTNSIVTVDTHQEEPGGSFDAFLIKFNNSGHRMWGTYYGGRGSDYGYSCAVDDSGKVYLAGNTASTDIATPGAQQEAYGGGNADAFLVKFDGTETNTSITDVFMKTSSLIIYPNPSKGQFVIQTEKGGTIELMDVTGKIINSYHINTSTCTINQELPAGIYYIWEKESNTIQTLIIE